MERIVTALSSVRQQAKVRNVIMAWPCSPLSEQQHTNYSKGTFTKGYQKMEQQSLTTKLQVLPRITSCFTGSFGVYPLDLGMVSAVYIVHCL
jgi:hypothetical protein